MSKAPYGKGALARGSASVGAGEPSLQAPIPQTPREVQVGALATVLSFASDEYVYGSGEAFDLACMLLAPPRRRQLPPEERPGQVRVPSENDTDAVVVSQS